MDMLVQVVTHIMDSAYPRISLQNNQMEVAQVPPFSVPDFVGGDVVLSNSPMGAMKHTSESPSCTMWDMNCW